MQIIPPGIPLHSGHTVEGIDCLPVHSVADIVDGSGIFTAFILLPGFLIGVASPSAVAAVSAVTAIPCLAVGSVSGRTLGAGTGLLPATLLNLVIGSVDFTHFAGSTFIARVQVGMILFGKVPVRFFDFLLRGGRRNAENLIRIRYHSYFLS